MSSEACIRFLTMCYFCFYHTIFASLSALHVPTRSALSGTFSEVGICIWYHHFPWQDSTSLGENLDPVQGGLSCMYAEGAYAYPFLLLFDLGRWGRAKLRPRYNCEYSFLTRCLLAIFCLSPVPVDKKEEHGPNVMYCKSECEMNLACYKPGPA